MNGFIGVEANEKNKGKLSVSSMDFVGLGFADKKEGRALPAGLVPIADDFAQGNLPEVEIIVGDSSNFGAATPKPQGDDPLDLYKPKVSSWGVFPRPNDISKTVMIYSSMFTLHIIDVYLWSEDVETVIQLILMLCLGKWL